MFTVVVSIASAMLIGLPALDEITKKYYGEGLLAPHITTGTRITRAASAFRRDWRSQFRRRRV